MYAKFVALIPLLGWFYLGILGIFAASVLLRYFKLKNVQIWLERSAFLGIALWMLTLSIQSTLAELALFPEAKKSFKDEAESKIEHEVGGFYTKYYKSFRPVLLENVSTTGLHDVHDLNLIGVDTKEFHYARMYLYPFVVLEAKSIHDGNTTIHIVPESSLQSIEHFKELIRTDGMVLIQTPDIKL